MDLASPQAEDVSSIWLLDDNSKDNPTEMLRELAADAVSSGGPLNLTVFHIPYDIAHADGHSRGSKSHARRNASMPVFYLPLGVNGGQLAAYRRIKGHVIKYAVQKDWIGAIDTDEFLYARTRAKHRTLRTALSQLPPDLETFMVNARGCDALTIEGPR